METYFSPGRTRSFYIIYLINVSARAHIGIGIGWKIGIRVLHMSINTYVLLL